MQRKTQNGLKVHIVTKKNPLQKKKRKTLALFKLLSVSSGLNQKILLSIENPQLRQEKLSPESFDILSWHRKREMSIQDHQQRAVDGASTGSMRLRSAVTQETRLFMNKHAGANVPSDENSFKVKAAI